MQRVMQADAAVFRTERRLAEGIQKIDKVYARMTDISCHRPLASSGTATSSRLSSSTI
jgi:succinate dehydrogenase/fumarate reductase flavoprotein subunit